MFALLSDAVILFCCLLCSHANASVPLSAEDVVKKMEAAYAVVQDYRTEVDVKSRKARDKFIYTFKKPNYIRIDFISPHSGWILIYPDEKGKAVVRSSGSKHFLELHLSTQNRLIKKPSGQRVDQTDMGLLINNISHSVTDKSKGPVKIAEQDGTIEMNVLAEDHFSAGVVTMYRFLVDRGSWLPIGVDEFTPDGAPKRTVRFRNTVVNLGTEESSFRLNK